MTSFGLNEFHHNITQHYNVVESISLSMSSRETGTVPPTTAFSPPTLVPALQPKVELGLTCTYITLYGILFLMVYIQLWMIWFYRHKRFSYQTVFLYLALIWSGLRVTLFAFYINDCSRVNLLSVVPYWVLFCFPVCLQFIILCLLVLFFAQVAFKARAKYEPSKYKGPLKICVSIAVIIFFGTNISCAVIAKSYESNSSTIPVNMLYIRVAINDTLFIIASITLSLCIYKLAKMSAASVVLEAKGTNMCQALTACVLIVFLYLSRAIYNIVAVCPVNRNKGLPNFGFNWINVTDQADFVKLNHGYAYLSFAIVLFVWELLPMFIVIILFRVRKPGLSGLSQDLPSHSQNSKAYFFDNPRRYDSEEDLTAQQSLNYPGINHNSYSVNDSGEISQESPRGTPSRPHRLGYGAVMSSDRNFSYSVSPVMPSPSHSGYPQHRD